MNLMGHTQAYKFTVVEPLAKRGRRRQGPPMDVYKKEKRSRNAEGKLKDTAGVFTFLEVLFYKSNFWIFLVYWSSSIDHSFLIRQSHFFHILCFIYLFFYKNFSPENVNRYKSQLWLHFNNDQFTSQIFSYTTFLLHAHWIIVSKSPTSYHLSVFQYVTLKFRRLFKKITILWSFKKL